MLLPFAVSASADEVDSRPNVLLILSDDQAWTDYSFMGHPHISTPNLDQLAAESLTYTRGYVTSPLCRPSLASILTGLPTHIHGTTGNDPATGDPTVSNMASRRTPRHAPLHTTLYDRLGAAPNVARLLRDAGYQTLQTGKWWEADPKTFGFTSAMTHGDQRDINGRELDVGNVCEEKREVARGILRLHTHHAEQNKQQNQRRLAKHTDYLL
jgi:uncharacterized sulfatase